LYLSPQVPLQRLEFSPIFQAYENSRVTDFLAALLAWRFGRRGHRARVTRSNAECTSLIKDGRSLAGTELLLTYAETMSEASSINC